MLAGLLQNVYWCISSGFQFFGDTNSVDNCLKDVDPFNVMYK